MRYYCSDQSLADYFKEYRAFHRLLPPKADSISRVTLEEHSRYDEHSGGKYIHYEESTVKLGPASLKFHRTLRVPDDAKDYLLPPVCVSTYRHYHPLTAQTA